jgi:hypothetical protein
VPTGGFEPPKADPKSAVFASYTTRALNLEERVGFEPTAPFGTTVFGTVALSRSATSPYGGEDQIRTGDPLRDSALAVRRLKPLGHLSIKTR